MAGAPPAAVGATLEEIDTPALVVELDAFERNLKALARAVEGRGVRVRAHAKTHKCPQNALRQIAPVIFRKTTNKTSVFARWKNRLVR